MFNFYAFHSNITEINDSVFNFSTELLLSTLLKLFEIQELKFDENKLKHKTKFKLTHELLSSKTPNTPMMDETNERTGVWHLIYDAV